MIKKIAWNIFKNTGDINTFLELKQIQNLEEQIVSKGQQVSQIEQQLEQQIGHQGHQKEAQMGEQNGNNQNEWYNNF